MVCIIDFDGTFLKNDFFEECFYKKLIENPLYILRHFLWSRKGLLELKKDLLRKAEVPYDIDFLINKEVWQWVEANRGKYSKIVVVSATPEFFVQNLLTPLGLFDEVYGSTSVNLKGNAKLQFIRERWGEDFTYIGDSRADLPIFSKASTALKVTKRGLIHVSN